jgi:hypothetical protein
VEEVFMLRLSIALCAASLLAAIPSQAAAIGIASGRGSFRVDSSLVFGNTTLFDGNTLETERASSELQLSSGIHVRLAADSRGKVFADRFELEKGLSELEAGGNYWMEARGLRVRADAPGSAGRVAVTGDRKVQALALTGSFRVTTSDGTVVALLEPGRALEFEPQAVTGAEAPFEMTGCLERRDGHYVLRDPISGVTEEVRGERLESNEGRMVEVTASVIRGAKPVVPGTLEVIQITRMRRVSGECVQPPAPAAPPAAKPAEQPPPGVPAPPAAPPAATPPAAGTPPAAQPTSAPTPTAPAQAPKAGMSSGTKAVIAGVIIGGAGAGAVVYWKTQQNENKGTISR